MEKFHSSHCSGGSDLWLLKSLALVLLTVKIDRIIAYHHPQSRALQKVKLNPVVALVTVDSLLLFTRQCPVSSVMLTHSCYSGPSYLLEIMIKGVFI